MSSIHSDYSSSGSSSIYHHPHRTPPPPPPPVPGKYVNPKMLTLPHNVNSSGQLQPKSPESGPFGRSRSTGNLAGSQYKHMNSNGLAMSPVPVPATSQLSDFEVEKVEMFYRSHRTHLFVGHCLVNLYVTETDLVDGGRQSKPRIKDWKLTLTGVPVLIFNKGETKSRDKRQIQICLAERGTGFPLWSDLIDALSNYSAIQPTFHTMYLSSDHRKMAGLSFDCPAASAEFYRQIEPIISNPLNISLSGPKKSKSKFFRRNRSKSVGRADKVVGDPWGAVETTPLKHLKPPNKADISSPCLFQHVTSVNLYSQEFPSILTSHIQSSSQTPLYSQYASSTASSPTSHSSNQTPVYSTPEPIESSDRNLGQTCSYGDLHSGQSGTSSNDSNLSY